MAKQDFEHHDNHSISIPESGSLANVSTDYLITKGEVLDLGYAFSGQAVLANDTGADSDIFELVCPSCGGPKGVYICDLKRMAGAVLEHASVREWAMNLVAHMKKHSSRRMTPMEWLNLSRDFIVDVHDARYNILNTNPKLN
jgi:hypothetical protein